MLKISFIAGTCVKSFYIRTSHQRMDISNISIENSITKEFARVLELRM